MLSAASEERPNFERGGKRNVIVYTRDPEVVDFHVSVASYFIKNSGCFQLSALSSVQWICPQSGFAQGGKMEHTRYGHLDQQKAFRLDPFGYLTGAMN